MRRLLIGLLFALGGACEKERPPGYEEGITVYPPPTDADLGVRAVSTPQDGFVYATDVTVIEAHPPTRFATHLPASVEDYTYEGDFGAVPTAYVWSRLCTGEEAMRDRVLAAVERGAENPGMEDLFVGLVNDCPTTSHCEWLTDEATSDRPYAQRMPFLRALWGCGPEHARPALRLPEAPPHIVVNWYLSFVPADSEDVPDELVRAIHLTAGAEEPVLDQAMLVLVRYPGTEAAALIDQLQAAEDEAARRRPDGYGDVGVVPTPLLQDACDVLLGAPQCPTYKGPPEEKYCNGSDLLYRHLTRNDRSAATLAGCAREEAYQDEVRLSALERLAWQDWGAAKAIATKIEYPPDLLLPTVETLRRFDSRDAMVAHLRELGLLGERRFTRYGYVITPVEEMALSGRLRQFTSDTDLTPARHDRLMFQMAELAGPVLQEVVFEELPPQDFGPYVLRAYARGKRWSVEATEYDGQFDMAQAVGLLNVVLTELGSDLRYQLIESGTYRGWALGAKDGLRAALDEGLFDRAYF